MKLPLANSSPWVKWSAISSTLAFVVLLGSVITAWDKLTSLAWVTRSGMEAYAEELINQKLGAIAPRLIDLEIQNYDIIRGDLEGRLFALELRTDSETDPEIRQAIRELKERIMSIERQRRAAECERALLAGRPFPGCGP